MPPINYHLVTTAVEDTWNTGGPILFLGEWCRLYDRRVIWQNLDSHLATPYGTSRAEKDSDQIAITKIKSSLFPKICSLLNKLNGVQYSDRFWKILIGHWFDYHTKVIFNRYRTLEKCIEDYSITSIAFLDSKYSSRCAPDTFESAIRNYSDQSWNESIYQLIFHKLSQSNIKVSYVKPAIDVQSQPSTHSKEALSKKLLKLLWRCHRKFRGFLQEQSSPFIIGSYLPRSEEKKLLNLFGLPAIPERKYEFKSQSDPDFELRDRLSQSLIDPTQDNYTQFIAKLLFQQIPTCYLEDFHNLMIASEQLPWPTNPQFIFTSNHFATDELFKIWVGRQADKGVPYITGQHGNNYGTHRYMNPSIEEDAADHFITWGWSESEKRDIPGFVLKLDGRQLQSYDPKGGLLLLELHSSLMVSTWDECAEFASYYVEQQRFVSKLNASIKNQLTIRLHNDFSRLSWSEQSRWHDFDSTLNIDTGAIPLSTKIAATRLVIFSYDSTGILETLSQNIPTLAFWQNDLDHLRESAIPYYQMLKEVKIIHNTPESAALFINAAWNDIEGWWQSEAVQGARLEFCKKYANLSHNPAKDLKTILDGF